MTKSIRPVGDIMLDMEKLLFELHLDHDLQHGEVLYMVNGWQRIHVPNHIETYHSGGNPTLHPSIYGPTTQLIPLESRKKSTKTKKRKK
jgi:hypothetical protein